MPALVLGERERSNHSNYLITKAGERAHSLGDSGAFPGEVESEWGPKGGRRFSRQPGEAGRVFQAEGMQAARGRGVSSARGAWVPSDSVRGWGEREEADES